MLSGNRRSAPTVLPPSSVGRRATLYLSAAVVVAGSLFGVSAIAAAQTPVVSPVISAPPDVVVGETDGYIDLPVTLSAPGVSPVTVNYATANGTADGAMPPAWSAAAPL